MTNLQQTLSRVAGTEIDITIRSAKEFTFSTHTVDKEAVDKIIKFFKGSSMQMTEIIHDEECGSFMYAKCHDTYSR